MAILYVAAAFVFFMWWVRGSFVPAIIMLAAFILMLIWAHSSYVYDLNETFRQYEAAELRCPSGAIIQDSFCQVFDRPFIDGLSAEDKMPAEDSSYPLFILAALIGGTILLAPYIITRHRARRFDRMINGVTFLGKD